jgi:hypothetical protein
MGRALAISASSARYGLRRFGVSHKKAFPYLKKKRDDRKKLKKIWNSKKLVYIEKSGIDITLCKEQGQWLQGKKNAQ